MKKLNIHLVAMAAMAALMMSMTGCVYLKSAGIEVAVPNPFIEDPTGRCSIYQDLGIDVATTTGIIPQYIKNPCVAQGLVVGVAQGGVVLEAYQVEDVRKFVSNAMAHLEVGRSFKSAKAYLAGHVGKLNREAGLLFLMVGDVLITLPDIALIQQDDVAIIRASLTDLLAKVEALGPLIPE